jgi:hypothetical protein
VIGNRAEAHNTQHARGPSQEGIRRGSDRGVGDEQGGKRGGGCEERHRTRGRGDGGRPY